MQNVLVVCTGNTCRSPMAAALLKTQGDAHFCVKSAGISAISGEDASFYAKQALQEQQIEWTHESKRLAEQELQWADIVVTMTNQHKMYITSAFAQHEKKVYTLYEYVEGDSRDISDPYGGTLQTYRATLQELQRLVHKWIKKMEEK